MALQPTLKKLATTLIAKFGRSVTHITVTAGEYNPSTGSSTTETTSTIKALITSYKARDYNDNISVGDVPMLTTTEVKESDKITVGTKKYDVNMVEAIGIEDGVAVYQCNLRGI